MLVDGGVFWAMIFLRGINFSRYFFSLIPTITSTSAPDVGRLKFWYVLDFTLTDWPTVQFLLGIRTSTFLYRLLLLFKENVITYSNDIIFLGAIDLRIGRWNEFIHISIVCISVYNYLLGWLIYILGNAFTNLSWY